MGTRSELPEHESGYLTSISARIEIGRRSVSTSSRNLLPHGEVPKLGGSLLIRHLKEITRSTHFYLRTEFYDLMNDLI